MRCVSEKKEIRIIFTCIRYLEIVDSGMQLKRSVSVIQSPKNILITFE